MSAAQIGAMTTEAFAALSPDQLGSLSAAAMKGVTAKQVARLSLTQIEGFPFFDGLSPAAFAGLTPRHYESGSSVRGKSRICKMGSSRGLCSAGEVAIFPNTLYMYRIVFRKTKVDYFGGGGCDGPVSVL
jgi:hypothetical protein